jgi:hypothetical protein
MTGTIEGGSRLDRRVEEKTIPVAEDAAAGGP